MDDKNPSAVDKSIEAEEPFKGAFEKQAKDVTQETESAESPGSQADKAEYVKGHPVIRNGADVSRFIVSVRDDGDPALTVRSIVLGSAFTALSSVITMLYIFKPTQMQVSAIFIQLLVYVVGQAWALFTPRPDRFRWKWLRRTLEFLNFGQPFGIKEHVVASLIASSGNNGLSGVEVYAVERLFYNISVSATTAVLGTFSISLCGFVLAGVLRPLIVYPAEMVYWSTLPQVVLYQNLHFDQRANRGRLIKFGWALGLAAIWEIFPAYIMTWLGGFSIFCLASMDAPQHTRKIFSKVFGGASSNEGLGLLNFGFDWQYIQSSFLSLPLKQQLNSWIGYVIFYPVMLALYYGNTWSAKSFPFMSTSLFNSNGKQFSTTSILSNQGTIDYDKLKQVGIPHLTSSTVWGYLTQNLAIGALITHVLIFYGKDMYTAWKQARSRTQPDPHFQAMLKYKEVPMWWYLALFVLAFFAGLIVNIKGETTLPAWGYIVSLLLGAFIAPFSCILYGLYGTGVATNQLSKMVAGAVILLSVNLANWLKVGQYTKVPHRIMFATQIYGTLLGAGLNYAVMTTIVSNQREILLDPAGNSVWSGSAVQSMNSQAITWALARDVYGVNGRYLIVPLGLLIGLALPVMHWGLNRVFPRVRSWPLNTAIIASFAGQTYYGITSWIWSSIAVGVFSQVWLRRRLPRIVIFILSFAVFGASGKGHPFPTWWGNPAGNPDHCI
ncbi:OPT family oligopeptide transporter [Aspergillus novofumigatus IBT 16806]|uniref:Peptide transporter MTD1 n=1 Tax=Aspergillus novofumigatus (strain IBT 16806) TaxID=1392255 RepID=A0A2I1BYH8_ASPN1|nr:peptide transporter MTD1 [Aspergillus novofumigatus IBT 16806]PKX90429.1 peptide transporter MTD1 [Aspergillus novofumigatus IBT 16806]